MQRSEITPTHMTLFSRNNAFFTLATSVPLWSIHVTELNWTARYDFRNDTEKFL